MEGKHGVEAESGGQDEVRFPPVPLLSLLVERLLPRGPRAALAHGAGHGVHARPPARAATYGSWPWERRKTACVHPHDVTQRQAWLGYDEGGEHRCGHGMELQTPS